MKKPFKLIGFSGLPVIVMSFLLVMVFPSHAPWMMDGFSTPILAFEFVQSPSEIRQMFGEPGSLDHLAMISAMDSGNRLDYLYMILYTLFLLSFCVACANLTGKKYYYSAGVLSLVILFADAMENIQLLTITAKMATLECDRELALLHGFTWIKWGGLALVFLILAPYFWSGSRFSKLICVTGLSNVILSVLAYVHRSILNELMALSVALMFVMMMVYCFVHRGNQVDSDHDLGYKEQ